MLGIGLVALMIFLGPVCVHILETYFPIPAIPEFEPPPSQFYGPSRRVFEIASALA